MNQSKDISPSAAHALIKKGALLVDVREPREVASKSFDVPEIMLIPLSSIEKRYQEIPLKRKVIVACLHGNRSIMALRMLKNHGYSNVVNMQNGFAGWERAGLPVNRKPKQSIVSWLLQKFSGKKMAG